MIFTQKMKILQNKFNNESEVWFQDYYLIIILLEEYKKMFLRRLLKDCSSQLQRHPQRSLSYVSKLLNLSKNPNLVQQKKYLHRMTPLHHETDHEVLSRPDEITCTFITKDGQRISVKGKIFIRPKHLIKTSQTKLILQWSQKLYLKIFWTFSDKVNRVGKLQNSDL